MMSSWDGSGGRSCGSNRGTSYEMQLLPNNRGPATLRPERGLGEVMGTDWAK